MPGLRFLPNHLNREMINTGGANLGNAWSLNGLLEGVIGSSVLSGARFRRIKSIPRTFIPLYKLLLVQPDFMARFPP